REVSVSVREGRLVAYVVGESEGLREELRRVLPEYMVPSAYVGLEALPLTSAGKVDRRRLPDPEWEDRGRYAEPRDEMERALAEVWREVLGVERVGRHDNFFDLGGDSIVAVRVVSRLRQTLKVDVPVRAVFTAPTVAELATRVGQAGVAAAPAL